MTYVAHTSRERNGSPFTFVAGHEIYQIYFARKQNVEVNTESALRKVPKTENEAHETFENNLKQGREARNDLYSHLFRREFNALDSELYR